MNQRLRHLGVAAACSAVISLASPPTIGVASAVGTFTVNGSEVQGNANLFAGSQIKTAKASSRVFMQNGVLLIVAIDSTVTIYSDHVVLQQGAARVDNMSGFDIRAGAYRVVSGQAASQAVVRLTADSFQVAALTGSLNVFDSGGVLLTRIGAGTAVAFDLVGGGGTASTPAVHGPRRNNNNVERRDAALFVMILAAAAALGLLVDYIIQASPTSP